MKTDDTPLHGSYFDLATAKHPDLRSPTGDRRPLVCPPPGGPGRGLPRRRRGRFGALPVLVLGALFGVAWLAIALRPEENVRAPVTDETLGRPLRDDLVSQKRNAPARKLFAPPPEYPHAARRAGEEGTVVIEADVDATGVVTGTNVVRGRGEASISPALDAAAASALETWRFEPARRGGVAVESTYRIAIRFALREDADTEQMPLRSAGASPRGNTNATFAPPGSRSTAAKSSSRGV